MIRLIAADLDGTLLDSRKRLSPGLFPLIRALRARGVRFAAASGRQYDNLLALFEPVADDLLFIAENGAVVCDGRRRLFSDALPKAYFRGPIERVRGLPGVNCVLCTAQSAYIECANDPVFLENARMYYEKLTIADDLLTVLETVPAFKLAVFEQGKAETGCWPVLRQYEDKFAVVLSGADWVDLMNPETNKGSGLHRMADYLGIPIADTMAFGDYLNDLELLREAGFACAMENGHPDLKRMADCTVPSNDENGVVRAIRAHFNL